MKENPESGQPHGGVQGRLEETAGRLPGQALSSARGGGGARSQAQPGPEGRPCGAIEGREGTGETRGRVPHWRC